MSVEKQLKSGSADIANEAKAWVAQLESGALSKEDLVAFKEWIGRSPRHYFEVRKAAQLSLDANALTEISDSLSDELRSSTSIFSGRKCEMFMTSKGVVATVLLGTLLLSSVFMFTLFGDQQSYHLVTSLGEAHEASLADGSSIKLNTNSTVDVEFAQKERRVFLRKGEAYFDVAHDAKKPFSVYIDDKKVTAIGTAFTVRKDNDELVVLVSEGKVLIGKADVPISSLDVKQKMKLNDTGNAVSHTSAQVKRGIFLEAGQKIKVSDHLAQATVEHVPPGEMIRSLSWRSGILDFQEEKLVDIVEEMQRYTPVAIYIDGEELKDLRLGGIFRAGETEAFFEALQNSFDVDVVRKNKDSVILRRSDFSSEPK